MFGIKELKRRLTYTENKLAEEKAHRKDLEKELAKMYRILKHHGNKPSCELNWTYNWLCGCNDAPILYMYINDEEYVLELPELEHCNIDRSTIDFRLDGKFVHFGICDKSRTVSHEFDIGLFKRQIFTS